MKNILSIILCLLCAVSFGQYQPTQSDYTVTNKAMGYAQATPADGRSMFLDKVNFVFRPFQSITELKTQLANTVYRFGNTIYVVDSGGVLNPDGTFSGGTNTFWMFRNGVQDADLVELNLFGGGGGTCTTCLLIANNLSDLSNPSLARSNLGLGAMAVLGSTASGDLSGTWPNITVAKFNGQLPSYYLNYNNLFNQPTIPAQLNPTCVGCSISGSYPNLTWTVTGSGFNTAGVGLIALTSSTVAIDTLNYRKMDSIWTVNDSTVRYSINGFLYQLSIRGGTGAGGGGGSGTVTIVTGVNANGIVWSISNPTSNPALTISLANITPTTVNGLTFAAVSGGFTITGGSGTPHTLTVNTNNASVAGANTGDITIAGENYASLASQVLTFNAVNLSNTNVTGTLAAARFGALTGDVTNSAGSYATTITNNAVTLAKMAQIGTLTILGNNTGGTANVQALTVAQVNAILPLFTTLLRGSVPAPGSVTGKVLSDAGTWVTNGTGNPNTKVGTGYWLVNGSDNTVKTILAGLGILIDSSFASQTLRIRVDTTLIQYRGLDSIYVQNVGAGYSLAFASGDTLMFKKIFPGANIIFTQNNDSSITISATTGPGSGITQVGLINSQSASSNGLVISGTTLYGQLASAGFPGMIAGSGSQTLSPAISFAVPITISTLTTPGGVYFGNASGQFQQTGVSATNSVLKGGPTPAFGQVNLGTDVTSVLPIANGGNGTPTPVINGSSNILVTGAWGNYTISTVGIGTVTSVAFSGGTTGYSVVGSPITGNGTITLSGFANVSGGGSGLNSLSPYALMAGGQNATGPMQQVSGTGTNGQFLKSLGANTLPVWADLIATANLTAGRVGFGSASNLLTGSANFTFDDITTKSLTILSPATAAAVLAGIVLRNPGSGGSLYNGPSYGSYGAGNIISFAGTRWYTSVQTGGMGQQPITWNLERVKNDGVTYNPMMTISSQSEIGGSILTLPGANSRVQAEQLAGLTGGFTTSLTVNAGSVSNILGGAKYGYVSQTGSYAMANTDNYVQTQSVTACVTTLPNAITVGTGTVVTISNIGTGNDTVRAQSSQQIVYGANTDGDYILQQGSSVQLISATFPAGHTPTNGWLIYGSRSASSNVGTLEQVLTAGSTISSTHTISYGSQVFSFGGNSGNYVFFASGAALNGFFWNDIIKTVNYNLTATDGIIYADATSANITITVPNNVTGIMYEVKKIDATSNTVTVVVNGGGTIDGNSSIILSSQYQSITLQAIGAQSLIQSMYLAAGSISGTFAPAISATTNVTSTSGNAALWTRTGNNIEVSGYSSVVVTGSGTIQFNASLPVSSNFTSATADCIGIGVAGAGIVAQVSADATNDKATITTGNFSIGATVDVRYKYSYIIK